MTRRFTKPYIYWNQALRRWMFSVVPDHILVPCLTFQDAIHALEVYLESRV